MTIQPKRFLALAKKELFTYFNAPAFYGSALFFLLFSSIWLFIISRFFSMDSASLRPYFTSFPIMFIIIIPVLTMKSWAEERKTGSLELILTMPLSEWDLVLGKFLALFALLAINLVFTIGIPLSLAPMGYFDTGVIICEYIGVLLLGASALSLGLLMSAISKNQAGSFLSCAAVMLFVMLVNQLVFLINLPQWLNNFITFISLSFHFESFSKGILNSNDLVFFLLSTFLFLFLNTIVILNRKWR